MAPILFHIYGPFAIHSFGAMIVLGLIITLYLLHHDKPLHNYINDDQLATIVQICFFTGIFGGRAWFLITNPSTLKSWTDALTVWSGGLSLLGALIAAIFGLLTYFYLQKLPALKILDRLALYTPLLQSISRFGCFFAGCCYGKTTDLPWGVIYLHQDSLAPLKMVIHPTQIYSSFLLAIIFVILMCFDRFYTQKKSGQIVALYLMLTSFERFIVDFLRGDQEFFHNSMLSIQQIVALCIFLAGLLIMLFVTLYQDATKTYHKKS